jgi:hypothetical protein
MRKLKLALTIIGTFTVLSTLSALDTLTVHAMKIKFEEGLFLSDGSIIKKELYNKLKAEYAEFEQKSKGKICWVKRLDKNDKIIEQGLFCDGTIPAGNVFRFNSEGKIIYKRIHFGVKITTCGQGENGTKSTEEAFDLVKGLRIYGTYENGLKHGQFLYYEKNTVVGAEAFEKGKLLKRRGKTFVINEDGSFKQIASTN